MTHSRFELPAMNTLLAFEATARLGSITLAAEERATSHSAISRHIRMLEDSAQARTWRLDRGADQRVRQPWPHSRSVMILR